MRELGRLVGVLAVSAVLAGTAASPVQAQQYVVTDLGTLGGEESYADGLNEIGQVVGLSQTADGTMRAFLWTEGEIIDLGSLSGGSSLAHSVNDLGQVVGESQTACGTVHAFLWAGGAMADLGTLGGCESFAMAINNFGDIVGNAQAGDQRGRPFLRREGVMEPLYGMNGVANDINETGSSVGWVAVTPGDDRSVIWRSGEISFLGNGGYANAVNALDQVVGGPNAFLWEGGSFLDLGTLSGDLSAAVDINDLSQVVGYVRLASGRYHAFLWEDGVMVDLNDAIPVDSGWELGSGSSINNRGQIVGWGYLNGVETPRAFLLSPADLFGCRQGNVNVAAGPIADVLLVNGSIGISPTRVVRMAVGGALTIDVLSPPSRPHARYALFVRIGGLTADDATDQSFDLGMACFPTPLNGSIQTITLANTMGHDGLLGSAWIRRRLPLAPARVFSASIDRTAEVSLQGFIQDDASGSAVGVSITNAIVFRVE